MSGIFHAAGERLIRTPQVDGIPLANVGARFQFRQAHFVTGIASTGLASVGAYAKLCTLRVDPLYTYRKLYFGHVNAESDATDLPTTPYDFELVFSLNAVEIERIRLLSAPNAASNFALYNSSDEKTGVFPPFHAYRLFAGTSTNSYADRLGHCAENIEFSPTPDTLVVPLKLENANALAYLYRVVMAPMPLVVECDTIELYISVSNYSVVNKNNSNWSAHLACISQNRNW